MLVMGDLGPVPTASSFLVLVLALGRALFACSTYRGPALAKSVARSVIGRLLPSRRFRSALKSSETRSAEFVSRLGKEFRAAHRHMMGRPKKGPDALGVGLRLLGLRRLVPYPHVRGHGRPGSPIVLIVAYGVSTAIGRYLSPPEV